MELTSERCYTFAAGVDEVWSAFAAVDGFPRWWPWLREFDATRLAAGEEWRCAVRSPLPITLRFTVCIDDVAERQRVSARLRGDIRGDATLHVRQLPGGSQVRLASRLEPTRPVFALLAAIARPLVVRAHDRILDTGARQFAAHAIAERPL